MSTLHYQPGAADMCDDKRALPILVQLAGAAAGGAEPLRRPRVGRLDIAAKKLRALSAARSSPGRAIADHLVPASDKTRPSRSPRALSLLRRNRTIDGAPMSMGIRLPLSGRPIDRALGNFSIDQDQPP